MSDETVKEKSIFKATCATQPEREGSDAIEVLVDDQGDFCFEIRADSGAVFLKTEDARQLARRILECQEPDFLPARGGPPWKATGGGNDTRRLFPPWKATGAPVEVLTAYAGGDAPGPARPFPTLEGAVSSVPEFEGDPSEERITEALSVLLYDNPEDTAGTVPVFLDMSRGRMLRLALMLLECAVTSGENPDDVVIHARVTTNRDPEILEP